jgi:hypothetical protein
MFIEGTAALWPPAQQPQPAGGANCWGAGTFWGAEQQLAGFALTGGAEQQLAGFALIG